jgi:glycosyltransferase involved in cell wall biosynthesis
VLKHLKILRKSIIDYKPDVIISFIKEAGAITALASYGLKHPLVFSERCDPSNRPKGFFQKIYEYIVNNRAKGFVFQSNAAMMLYPKKVQSNATVIFNPINISNFPPSYSGERRKEIVSVGRLDYQKNR